MTTTTPPADTARESRDRAGSWVGSRMVSSRLIGSLFLLGFVCYGTGFALVSSVIGAADFPASVPEKQTLLVIGVFLMLMNTAVDVGKAVLFFPILDRYGRRTALTYLAALIIEVVLLTIGALSLLLLIPIAGAPAGGHSLAPLAVAANAVAYQVAEMTLAIGCLFLFALLYRSRLIPRFLSVWGIAGYGILLAGSVAELCGLPVGTILSIPGGLLELALAFWLLIKGFAPTAYDPVG